MKSVSIFGATGSVGLSTLDLIRREPDAYKVVALTANSDVDGLAAQAKATGAQFAVVGQERLYGALKEALAGSGVEAAAGEEALVSAAQTGADWTMASIVGCAGLRPTIAALKAIQPHLVPGSVILFDELTWAGAPGEAIAFKEAFRDTRYRIEKCQLYPSKSIVTVL